MRGFEAPRARARLEDIAEAAGVSLATVDRVLNERAGVRAATAQRVLRAANQLDYLPFAALPQELPSKPLRVVFVLPSATSHFMDLLGDIAAGPHEQWAPYHVRCRVEMIESFNPRVLADRLLEQRGRADAVACMALEHPLVRDAINTLTADGVPVVTLVSDLSQSRRAAYIGLDNRAAGRTAGLLLGRFLGPRAAKVAIIAGSLSYRAHEEREMGFIHLLEQEFPRLEVLGLREGEDDVMRNYQQARRLMGQYPDLAGIYNIGGASEGVAQALREAGRAQEVIFISHGLTPDTRALLIDGTLDALITQEPRAAIRGCVRTLFHLQRQRELVSDEDASRLHIIVRESLV